LLRLTASKGGVAFTLVIQATAMKFGFSSTIDPTKVTGMG